MMFRHFRKLSVLMTIAVMASGCQHIQLAKNPIPITLTPNPNQLMVHTPPVHTHQPIILTPTNSPIKNKPNKHKPTRTKFYLLENWF